MFSSEASYVRAKVAALVLAVIAVRAVAVPEQMASGLGHVLTGPNGYSEFYAIYLGVLLALFALETIGGLLIVDVRPSA